MEIERYVRVMGGRRNEEKEIYIRDDNKYGSNVIRKILWRIIVKSKLFLTFQMEILYEDTEAETGLFSSGDTYADKDVMLDDKEKNSR